MTINSMTIINDKELELLFHIEHGIRILVWRFWFQTFLADSTDSVQLEIYYCVHSSVTFRDHLLLSKFWQFMLLTVSHSSDRALISSTYRKTFKNTQAVQFPQDLITF